MNDKYLSQGLTCEKLSMKKKYTISQIGIITSLLMALLVTAACSAHASYIVPANDRPTLMYFRANLCPYCKKVSPIVDGIKRKYRGQLNVVTVSLDHSEGKELAREHQIVGAPTILLLDNEGNQVNVLRGSLPPPLIEQAVEDLVTQ